MLALAASVAVGTLPAVASAQGADAVTMPLHEAFEPGFQVLSAQGRGFLDGVGEVVLHRPTLRRRVRIYCGSRVLGEALVQLVEAYLAAVGVPSEDVDIEAIVWSNSGPGSVRVPRLAIGFGR